MNNIERLKASLRALTQQHIDLHDMWTYGASERATASELINNNHQQQTPQTPQQEVYRVSERSERTPNNNTQNMNNINSQRQQLREVLWQLEEQHANLHTMYTYGPRDEVTGRIEPTQEELYPVEQFIYDIEHQLMVFEYKLDENKEEAPLDDSPPF